MASSAGVRVRSLGFRPIGRRAVAPSAGSGQDLRCYAPISARFQCGESSGRDQRPASPTGRPQRQRREDIARRRACGKQGIRDFARQEPIHAGQGQKTEPTSLFPPPACGRGRGWASNVRWFSPTPNSSLLRQAQDEREGDNHAFYLALNSVPCVPSRRISLENRPKTSPFPIIFTICPYGPCQNPLTINARDFLPLPRKTGRRGRAFLHLP